MITASDAQIVIDCLVRQTPTEPAEIDLWYFGLISALEDRDGPDTEMIEALKYLRWRKKWPRPPGGWHYYHHWCFYKKKWMRHQHGSFEELGLLGTSRLYAILRHAELIRESISGSPTFAEAVLFFCRCYPLLKPHLKPMEEMR